MPIFSSSLKNLEKMPSEEAIAQIAKHIRTMQDELEYRLSCLDSANISEIDATLTPISTEQGNIIDVVGGLAVVVQDFEGQMGQYLKLDPTGIYITNAQGDQLKINGGQIDASSLNLKNRITFTDLDAETQDNINSSYNMASNASYLVSGWSYLGSTYIDGNKIATGTVRASTLEGGTINLLNGYGTSAGSITLGGADSAGYAVSLSSGGALQFTSGYGNISLIARPDGWNAGGAITLSDAVAVGGVALFPASDGGMSCGLSTYRWSAIYTASGTAKTSDRNAKHDIQDLPNKYLDMLEDLKPSIYKMNDGTSDRYHVGYIAQDVEEAMSTHGISSQEFGGFVKDKDKKGNDIYMLRYDEFMALHTAAIQKLQKRVEELERRSA